MKVEDLEAGDGPDTALARALHASGVLELAALRACLDEARAGSRALAELLVERELLDGASLSRAFVGQPASREGPLHLGEVVAGRYQVTELLGMGGMGAVYGVRELAGRRDLALKVILPEVASEVDLQRFRQEGEIAARLGAAQGFVVVHAAGEHRGLSWFVMERVEGRDLKAALAEGLPLPRLVEILTTVARSLHACHEQGIVHRDLKPANVLLTASGPKVADLGLARERDRETLTQTGEVLGTPAYMAPEQLVDARRVDARTDVYALGAILYRGLSGQPPFSGPLFQVLHAIASKEPPRPSEIVAEAPPALEAVCLRAMAKQPEARYASALEFAEGLAAADAESAAGIPLAPWPVGVAALVLLGGALALWVGSRAQVASSDPEAATPTPTGIDSAEGERLRELFASDWLPKRLERQAELWATGVARRHGAGEAARLKREVWREVRPSARARLLADADPGAALRRLGAVLKAPPALEGELAAISSAAFGPLRARWEAQDEAAYPAALGLQRARIALTLGEAPLWLQQEAYSRFSEEEGVIDCLQLGVPIRAGLAFANVKRFKHLERPGDLGRGQLALYLQLSRYDPRALKREEQGATLGAASQEVCELWGTLGDRPRDLGQRYVHEIECLGLRAAGSWLTWRQNQDEAPEVIAAEAQRLVARCLELREQVRYELVYELANVEQGLRLLLKDYPGNVELWDDVLRRIERDRDRPRAGPFWFPDHLRGRSLVRLGWPSSRSARRPS